MALRTDHAVFFDGSATRLAEPAFSRSEEDKDGPDDRPESKEGDEENGRPDRIV